MKARIKKVRAVVASIVILASFLYPVQGDTREEKHENSTISGPLLARPILLAKQFAEAIALGRYSQARGLLAPELSKSLPDIELKQIRENIRKVNQSQNPTKLKFDLKVAGTNFKYDDDGHSEITSKVIVNIIHPRKSKSEFVALLMIFGDNEEIHVEDISIKRDSKVVSLKQQYAHQHKR